MGFTVDENYGDRTTLKSYWRTIKSNIRKISDFLNKQQSEINTLDERVSNINDVELPQKNTEIENNKNNIAYLTRFADVIIESEENGASEKIAFQNAIPGVKYCVFLGNTPLTEKYIDMTEPTVANVGTFESDNVKIKFFAEDGCELKEITLDVVTIAGIKIAFLMKQKQY